MNEDYDDDQISKPPGHVQFTGDLDIDQQYEYLNALDELELDGTDDQSDAQLNRQMISHYNDYVFSAQRDKLFSGGEEGSAPVQIQPSYLNETFSSRAPDYCAQEEVERVNNSFRSGSHWTIKKLPTHFEPGSIRTERKAHTMTNLLGMISVSESATKKSFISTKK
jgi:hypothetical protein